MKLKKNILKNITVLFIILLVSCSSDDEKLEPSRFIYSVNKITSDRPVDLNLDGTSRTDMLIELEVEYNRFSHHADIRIIESVASREDDNLVSVFIPYHAKGSEIHGHPLIAYSPFSFRAIFEDNSRFVINEFHERERFPNNAWPVFISFEQDSLASFKINYEQYFYTLEGVWEKFDLEAEYLLTETIF